MEGDIEVMLTELDYARFQSTPSAWRETYNYLHDLGAFDISIHSLRMEGDDNVLRQLHPVRHISIHSLRMEGDPGLCERLPRHPSISIHSLRMEGDFVK